MRRAQDPGGARGARLRWKPSEMNGDVSPTRSLARFARHQFEDALLVGVERGVDVGEINLESHGARAGQLTFY